MKNGKVDLQGTYDDLMKETRFSELINNHVATANTETLTGDQQKKLSFVRKKSTLLEHNFMPMVNNQIIDEEQLEKGKLTKEDTSTATAGFQGSALYFGSAVGAGLTSIICFYFFVVHGIRIGSD